MVLFKGPEVTFSGIIYSYLDLRKSQNSEYMV